MLLSTPRRRLSWSGFLLMSLLRLWFFLCWPVLLAQSLQFELSPQDVLSGSLQRNWETDGILTLQTGVLDLTSSMMQQTALRPARSRMWSKHPLPTDLTEFEIRADFEMTNNYPDGSQTHGFAIWYTYDKPPPATATDLLGGPPDFNGVVAFFSTRTRNGNTANSVSGAINEPSKVVTVREVPSQYGVYWNFRGAVVNFRMRVLRDSVTAQAKLATSDKWNDMFAVPAIAPHTIKPGGYVGITAMGIVEPEPVTSTSGPEAIRIHYFGIHNAAADAPATQRYHAAAPVNPPIGAGQSAAPPAVATSGELTMLTAMVQRVLQRMDVLEGRSTATLQRLASLDERIGNGGHVGEKMIGTSVEVLSRHLNAFKSDLDEHKRVTAHLVSAHHDEKEASSRAHFDTIKVQVERHARVTWLVLALLVVTAGTVAAVLLKSAGVFSEKAHVF